MTNEQLREVLGARPFRPFTMQLADGSKVHVPHSEFMLPHPKGGRTVAVAMSGDAFKIVDLLLVTAIEVGNGRPARRGKKK
ncbi:MAG: hypothetical protein C4547_14555 [Phycisphaerales bacterium]|nr:MAG: hypothetical protein C4547_14555 [Phycisphaerales bacterium]